jgi:poly-beta-hydroxyalkanoate depolymerase
MYRQLIENFGFFSLYRGFFAYSLATFLWHFTVPITAKHKYYKHLLESDTHKDNMKLNFFDEDEEEVNEPDNK